MKRYIFSALLITALPFAIANADRPQHKPPQAAFDVCAKSKQGDACTVTANGHDRAGTCETFPDTTALACRPAQPPGPPPQAIEACANSNEGDACTVTLGEHAVPGTCVKGPDGNGPLACRPAHPHR
jgi:hypothetical protein